MRLVTITPDANLTRDNGFVSGLFQIYDIETQQSVGVEMSVRLNVVNHCFLDSLPINWDNLIPDLLLPFMMNPSTDETGVIFEISRFVSKVVVLLSDELS